MLDGFWLVTITESNVINQKLQKFKKKVHQNHDFNEFYEKIPQI